MHEKLLPVNVLDALERNILTLIAKNPSISVTTISETLDKDRKTIRSRLKKLTKIGVLSGPEFVVNPYTIESNYALIHLDVGPAKIPVVTEILEELPGVVNISYSYSGKIHVMLVYNSPRRLNMIISKLTESGITTYTIEDNLHVISPPYSFEELVD